MKGLRPKYFVVKPHGTSVYAEASRNAIRAYATKVVFTDRELYTALHAWANTEELLATQEREKHEQD